MIQDPALNKAGHFCCYNKGQADGVSRFDGRQ